ncbi:hypothetical protein GN316_03040 [Xylophilus sp. Kf1]|nr:hypothetical protein [Xylophilus sp. Kf1]
MKVDALTGAAVLFAGFAAWYALTRGKPNAATLTPAQQTAYGMATAQRQDSGSAQWMNGISVQQLMASLNWSAAPYDAATATRRSDFQ